MSAHPSHWSRGRIKWDTSMISGSTPMTNDDSYWLDGDDEAGTPFVAIADMSRRDRVASTSKRLSQEGLESRKMPIGKPGTILFAMYASVGEAAFLDIEATWNQAILGITPNDENVNSRFLRYILLNMRDDLLREVRTNTQANLNATQVGNIWYGRPPLDEQRAIADYLDRETQKIDEIITEQRGLIETLRERWTGKSEEIFGKYVAGTSRLRWFLEDIDQRAGEKGRELPLFSVSIDWGVRRRSGDVKQAEGDLTRYKVARRGDVVLNRMRAFQGALGVAPEDGLVSPDYSVLRTTNALNSEWLSLVMRSPAFVGKIVSRIRGIGGVASGAVRTPRLNFADLREISIDIPDLDRQSRDLSVMSHEVSRIDELISESEDLIALSQERRSALITAAVTGQIDVRTAA